MDKSLKKYLDWITPEKEQKMLAFEQLLLETNQQINLISRKETEFVWTRHILHSISIAKVLQFKAGMLVADVGTGGGLPGIPLAILFPETQFVLIDSIGKKIRAVQNMCDTLGIKNVKAMNVRMEEVNQRFDFVVSRAVSSLPTMTAWLNRKIKKGRECELPNGLIYIKGGDFQNELDELGCNYRIWYVDECFEDPFFETKKIVWLDLAR